MNELILLKEVSTLCTYKLVLISFKCVLCKKVAIFVRFNNKKNLGHHQGFEFFRSIRRIPNHDSSILTYKRTRPSGPQQLFHNWKMFQRALKSRPKVFEKSG